MARRFGPAEEEVCTRGGSHVAVIVMLSTLARAMVVILERTGKREGLENLKEGRWRLEMPSMQVCKCRRGLDGGRSTHVM